MVKTPASKLASIIPYVIFHGSTYINFATCPGHDPQAIYLAKSIISLVRFIHLQISSHDMQKHKSRTLNFAEAIQRHRHRGDILGRHLRISAIKIIQTNLNCLKQHIHLQQCTLTTALAAALQHMFQVEQQEHQRVSDRGDGVSLIQMQLLKGLHDPRQYNAPLHMM